MATVQAHASRLRDRSRMTASLTACEDCGTVTVQEEETNGGDDGSDDGGDGGGDDGFMSAGLGFYILILGAASVAAYALY